MYAHPGQERQIPTSRMSDDGEVVRVDLKVRGPVPAQPGIGILQILTDRGELGFRSQAIVNGNDGISGCQVQLRLLSREHAAVAENQPTPVYPYDGWPLLLAWKAIDICPDVAVLHGLIGIGLFDIHPSHIPSRLVWRRNVWRSAPR